MTKEKVSIDKLIEAIINGGTVRTGVDIFNEKDVLLLEKDVLVNNVNILLNVKKNGVLEIPINLKDDGGIWDKQGNRISLESRTEKAPPKKVAIHESETEKKVKRINELKKEASQKYKKAKENIKKVISEIQRTGGEFDYSVVEDTVTDLFNFLTRNDNAFSYLTKEIFSYDDYLYNHSINVCTVGTAVLKRFNDRFNDEANKFLTNLSAETSDKQADQPEISYINYLPDELFNMSVGFFLHDVGKVLIPGEILNKPGRLTEKEFELIKKHSFEKGAMILKKNSLNNSSIKNTVKYHHCALFKDEKNCYPEDRLHIEIPPYVKICKLSDIYDAMTSKRCYKDAYNPIAVVSEIFEKYANKDHLLQVMLYSFVKVIGIYPPGSIVFLRNRQMAYIIDSTGPVVLPFTDTNGTTLRVQPDPIDLSDLDETDKSNIDRREPLKSPADIYDKLPPYLKESAQLG